MSKPKPSSRREAVAKIQAQQKAKERRRTLLTLAPALVLAIVIGVVVYLQVQQQADPDAKLAALSKIGVPAADACNDVVTKPAEGNADHRDEGTPIDYEDSPPATGPHWGQFLVGGQIRKFWTVEDRPPLERLVHSSEHGWTIVWYDETIAADDAALDDLRDIVDQYAGNDLEDKVMVAPWTKDDGEPFPDDTHVALTHWSMGDTNGNPEGQLGVWQYCSEVSGEAVGQFVVDYPYSDSPEPGAA